MPLMNTCCSNWILKLASPIIVPNLRRKEVGIVKSCLTATSILWFHFILAWKMKAHISVFKRCDTAYCEKKFSILIIRNLCLLFMCGSLFFKRTSMKRLLNEYHSFYNHHAEALKQCTMVTNVITCFLIAAYVANSIMVIAMLCTREDLTSQWYAALGMFETTLLAKRIILFVYVASSRFLYTFIPGMISVLHITLFMSIKAVLSRCDEQSNDFTASKNVHDFISSYAKFHKMAMAVESAISMEMFFMTSYQYLMTYFMISDLYVKVTMGDAISRLEEIFQYPQLFTYVFTVLVASEIHDQDISLRAKIKDLAFQMNFSCEMSRFSDILRKYVDSKPVVTFTVWKMFIFTRTFLITSLGVLLTYGILFLQIQAPEDKKSIIHDTSSPTACNSYS